MTTHRQDVEEIAEEAANKAVRKMMIAMGVDISDEGAMIAMQADFRHLRTWRESTDAVKRRALLTAVGVLITGFVGYALVVFGFKAG